MKNITKNYIDLSEEEKDTIGHDYFCGSCESFETGDCPFLFNVNHDTFWRSDDGGVGCSNFYN